MVYGFFLVGSILVGAIYWIVSEIQTPVQDVKWAPGTGLLHPEPWLLTDHGGYFGWKPKYENQYYLWGPGAYYKYFKPTSTKKRKTTPTTTRPTRRPIKLPPQLPSSLPPPIGQIGSSSSSSSSSSSELSDSPSSESDLIISSEIDPNEVDPKPPQIVHHDQEEMIMGSTVKPPEDYYPEVLSGEADYRRLWTSKDQNEEAYEENPQDFVNTRPPSKLPVEGWGYD